MGSLGAVEVENEGGACWKGRLGSVLGLANEVVRWAERFSAPLKQELILNKYKHAPVDKRPIPLEGMAPVEC